MKAYLEVKDILGRVKHGTPVNLVDLETDKIMKSFVVGQFNYKKELPREILDGEPFDIIVNNNLLTIVVSKDE